MEGNSLRGLIEQAIGYYLQNVKPEGSSSKVLYEGLVSELAASHPQLLDPNGVDFPQLVERIRQGQTAHLRDCRLRRMVNPVYRFLKEAGVFYLKTLFQQNGTSGTELFCNPEFQRPLEQLVEEFQKSPEYKVVAANFSG